MIKKLIRQIRRQPKGTRDGVALMLAGVFSFLVFSVWVFNTPARLASIEASYANSEKPDFGSSIGSMFGNFKDQIATAFGSLNGATTTETNLDTEDLSNSSQKSTSSIIIPSMDELISDITRDSDPKSTTTYSSEAEFKTKSTVGREVRIITTQTASSASSTEE